MDAPEITKPHTETSDVATLREKIKCLRITLECLLKYDMLTNAGQKNARDALTLYD